MPLHHKHKSRVAGCRCHGGQGVRRRGCKKEQESPRQADESRASPSERSRHTRRPVLGAATHSEKAVTVPNFLVSLRMAALPMVDTGLPGDTP